MEFLSPEITAYCEAHTGPESALLADLNRQTHLRMNSPRMLSGHLQGRLLSFLSTMQRPSFILEIGTYTGYSALCLAEGLVKGGRLITIDPNEETMNFARQYFDKSPYAPVIDSRLGHAQDVIPQLGGHFDLVFIDADKKNYSNYFDLVIDRVSAGGLIIADNVLWSGKVLEEARDADTQAIVEFNIKVHKDPRIDVLMLPLRDGITLLRKKN